MKYYILIVDGTVKDGRYNTVEDAYKAAKIIMDDMPDGTNAKILRIEDIGFNMTRCRDINNQNI